MDFQGRRALLNIKPLLARNVQLPQFQGVFVCPLVCPLGPLLCPFITAESGIHSGKKRQIVHSTSDLHGFLSPFG